MESSDHVCVAQVGLHGFVGRCDLEVDHDAVHIIDYTVD